jgi:hypothetical protein
MLELKLRKEYLMSISIYKDVQVINREEDKKLKVAPIKGFSYASDVATCIVTVAEFFQAAQSQPVVFAKNEQGDYIALAVMALKDGKNVFVKDDGTWRENEYIPAFIRRYPFIYIQHDVDKLTLAIDHDNKAVNKRKGEAIFDADGEPTDFTQKVLDFLNEYQQSTTLTQTMIKMLDEKGLLEDSTASITRHGEEVGLTGFLRVNEEKLSSLPDSDVLDLIKSGAYKWIVAHLMSLTNFKKLMVLSEK